MSNPKIKAILDSTDRYEATSIPVLEQHLQEQIAAKSFNLEISLALVKLYQFYPEKLNLQVLILVLTQALVHVEQHAFTLALYMLPEKIQQNESVALLIALSEHLETAQFRDFWDKLGNAKDLISKVPGFTDDIRAFITRVFIHSAKTVSKAVLSSALGLSDSELGAFITANGWTVNQELVVFPEGTQPTPKVAHENIQFNQLTNLLSYLR